MEVKNNETTSEPSNAFIHTPPIFETEAFYRTIIDNNLFRPLGWRPPRPIEPYRLIGTILPIDANTPPQAILQTTAGQKTYIVSTGEKIDASTRLVSIQGNRSRYQPKDSKERSICRVIFESNAWPVPSSKGLKRCDAVSLGRDKA